MANPIVEQISAELENLHNELGNFKSNVEYLTQAKQHVKEAVNTVNYAEENFNKRIKDLKNTYNSFMNLSDSVTAIIVKLETVNFPERLDSIEHTIQDTISILNETKESTLYELKQASKIITEADFDGRFKKLQASITSSVEANQNLANSIENQKLPDKIDDFQKSINNKLETSIKEFQKNIRTIASESTKVIQALNLPDKIDKLENNFNESLDTSIIELQKNTQNIASETAKSMQDLNLPIRIDKLDANISGILTAIHNVHSRIESVERNIDNKLKDSTDKHISSLINFQEKANQKFVELQQEMRASSKKQDIKSYITWSLIIISSAVVIYLTK